MVVELERFVHYQGFDCLQNARHMNSREDVLLHSLFEEIIEIAEKNGYDVVMGTMPKEFSAEETGTDKPIKVIELKATFIPNEEENKSDNDK